MSDFTNLLLFPFCGMHAFICLDSREMDLSIANKNISWATDEKDMIHKVKTTLKKDDII